VSKRISLGLDRFSGLYLWALFIIVFSVWAPDTFPTTDTVHLLASTQAIAGIAAIGLLVPMVAGQFDLSIGATANLSGMTAVLLQSSHGVGSVWSMLIGVLIGGFIGLVNGAVVFGLRVSSFIATLGMGSILVAFQDIFTGGIDPPPISDRTWINITQTKVLGFQLVVVYLILIALIVWWVLERTPAGRYMRAAGSNPEAARLSGVRVVFWGWLSLVASGMISGLAGVLFVSLTGPSLTFGPTLLLPAFAAVFLGSTQLVQDRFNVWGTLLAIFVLATGVQGLQLVSGVQWIGSMFNGVALLGAVALAASKGRRVPQMLRRRAPSGSSPEGTPPEGASGSEGASTASVASSPV
jgi:ribose transport system permease protein